jgi:hypothetical protein
MSPICQTDLDDEDLAENIAAAAERCATPVTAWSRAGIKILGPRPSAGVQAALSFALERTQVRAAELARVLSLSVPNASNKLKQLWEGGYLMRRESVAASGGNEFIYRRIG